MSIHVEYSCNFLSNAELNRILLPVAPEVLPVALPRLQQHNHPRHDFISFPPESRESGQFGSKDGDPELTIYRLPAPDCLQSLPATVSPTFCAATPVFKTPKQHTFSVPWAGWPVVTPIWCPPNT